MTVTIGRRELLAALGGAAAAWPLAADAQQPAKVPTIGFLGPTTAAVFRQWTEVFVERLRELGWSEGRTITIEFRWAEARNERFAEIAEEFVRRKVDVIFTAGNAIPAAKQATSVVPIVFVLSSDPVGSGFVASLARPGGNITGVSSQSTDTVGKRLELLREIVPSLRRLAILGNVRDPGAALEMREAHDSARALGLEIAALEIRRTDDIEPAFEALKGGAEALYVCPDALVNTNRIRINTLALAARLPTAHSIRKAVEAGGLLSFTPNFSSLFRRGADIVDKILRGAKPGDIPVEQPTRFDLVINRTTAKALGLTIPDKLLALADEVIE